MARRPRKWPVRQTTPRPVYGYRRRQPPRLQGWARRQQLTLNTLVQGAWALLLSRYSGSQDVCFGVTVAGRPATLPGVESMVGLFINTLPLRVAVPPDMPLARGCSSCRRGRWRCGSTSTAPWSRSTAGATCRRERRCSESLLVFENYPVDRALPAGVGGGVRVSDVELREQTNYALTVVAMPGAELELRAGYERGRFEEGAVRRLLGHLQTLLEAMPTAGERLALSVAAIGGGGAAAGAAGVEPDSSGLSAGRVRPRVVRAAGGAQSR